MEQIYFGQRIAALRKAKNMTQEGLAQKLGVTNQAVSKWESDQCCPDIMQLPGLADIFEISMDELFGRETPQNPAAQTATETVVDGLPWEDNNDLHAVCYVGHRLVSYRDVPTAGGVRVNFSFSCFKGGNAWASEPVQLAFSGTVDNIYSDFTVVCTQSQIQGDVKAGDSVTCEAVGGDVQAGDSVTCGNVGGSVSAGDSVSCTGNIGMNAQAGDDIRCEGMIGDSATAGGDMECGGDIGGRVRCGGDMECRGSVGGDVRADGDVQCSGDIHGSVDAEGDVSCTGSITGNATAEGDIECGNIHGSASAGGDIRCSRMGE